MVGLRDETPLLSFAFFPRSSSPSRLSSRFPPFLSFLSWFSPLLSLFSSLPFPFLFAVVLSLRTSWQRYKPFSLCFTIGKMDPGQSPLRHLIDCFTSLKTIAFWFLGFSVVGGRFIFFRSGFWRTILFTVITARSTFDISLTINISFVNFQILVFCKMTLGALAVFRCNLFLWIGLETFSGSTPIAKHCLG